MTYGFLDIAMTPSVKAAQAANGVAEQWSDFRGHRAFDHIGDNERDYIAARDTLFMATVSQTGWPYIQHRGGPPGFLKVLDDRTLGFADFRGNRQYISVGNLAADDRTALILVDYPRRARMKLYGHVTAVEARDDPQLIEKLMVPGYRAKPERALLFKLEAFDWNCPQHITPRYSEAELKDVLAPVRERLAALEEENRMLREKLAAVN
jgi:predicted pyridoxine 5'-phosphate oxidase superfamily flavin-nucleotide-binding protein